MREGKVCTAAPNIKANFGTNGEADCYGTINFDSGAIVSYVHDCMITHSDYTEAGPRVGEFYGAGGDKLKLKPYVIDIKVNVGNKGVYEFKNVLVATSDTPSRTMLVGQSDLERLGIDISFAKKCVTFSQGALKGVPLPMERNALCSINPVKPTLSKEDPEKIQQLHDFKSEDRLSTVGNVGADDCKVEDCCVNLSKRQKEGEPFICPTRDPNLIGDPKGALLREMERIRQRDRETFTDGDINIDEVGAKRHPIAAAGIRRLCGKYKSIFARDTGCLPPEFAVKGTITGKMSNMRAGDLRFEGSTHDAVIKQFLRKAAHGVMVNCHDHQIEPKNLMRVLAVKKKDDKGNILEPINNTRIVLDSTFLNAHTQFCGMPTDPMEPALNFASKVSASGLNFICDISECYEIVPMDKSLWPYFCVKIPELGTWAMTRTVQGWSKSAQAVQDKLDYILYPLAPYLRKYMDDIILGVEGSEEKFLEVLEKFFQICLRYGIRLKGSKCVFLSPSYNYLGVEINEGTVGPNKHKVIKLKEVEWSSITTKGKLRTFVGAVGFLARFMRRSAEILRPLQKAMSGAKADKLVQTAELEEAFNRVKRALGELTRTHPFDPDLQTVVVVDTSLLQTGGFLYQIGRDGAPKMIAFFSRTRKDAERAVPLSSCHMEIIGAKCMCIAFYPMLSRCKKTITLITDSAAFVKIFTRFKKQVIVSDDTVINNALYIMGTRLDMNVIHMKNEHALIDFSDTLSRLSELLGTPLNPKECADTKCQICDAAQVVEAGRMPIANAVNDICRISNSLMRESIFEDDALPRRKVDLEIFALRKPTNKALFPTFAEIKNKKFDLRTLLDDHRAIAAMQAKSADLRKIRRGLEDGRVNYPKHEARLQKMIEDEQAQLSNQGVITVLKYVNGQPTRLIPLPQVAAPIVIAAIHQTVGHRSVTQITKHLLRYFQVPKARQLVEAFTNNCVRCCLERGSGSYHRKEMKPVPLPEGFFRTILMDEMTRTYKNKGTVKMVVAMEGLSNFVTAVTYTGGMTAETFVAILAHCKSILCPHGLDNVTVQLRTDGATWHTSETAREVLALLNVELIIHPTATFSKNSIPELDTRMRQLGQHLSHFVESKPVPLDVAVHLAVAKLNSQIGLGGLTAAECLTGRGWRNNEVIQLDAKQLLERLGQRRENKRLYEQRRLAKKKQKAELELVPYDDPDLNSPLVRNQFLTKIKIGDTVQLKVKTDKNDVPTAWLVQKIDFSKKQLLLKKNSGLDTGRGECRWINFDLVERVFPAQDQIYQLYLDQEEEGRRKKSKMSEFIARTVLLANTMQSAPVVPSDLEMVPDLQPPKVAEPWTLIIKTNEIPKVLEIGTDDEEFSTPLAGEETPSAEDQKVENRGKRTKSGRLTREPIRFQAGVDDVKQKLNFERTAVGRTGFRKKKKTGKTEK